MELKMFVKTNKSTSSFTRGSSNQILDSKWNAVEFQNTDINKQSQSIEKFNILASQQEVKYISILIKYTINSFILLLKFYAFYHIITLKPLQMLRHFYKKFYHGKIHFKDKLYSSEKRRENI